MAPLFDFAGWKDRMGDNVFATASPKPFEFISGLADKISPPADVSKPKPAFSEKANHDAPNARSAKASFPRLGRSVHVMRQEYDVVVIGSGYGGGVAASRMARAGKSVAVLEMGKEKWPGEYPNSLTEVLPEFHVSGDTGKPTGMFKTVATGTSTSMYNLILGQGQNAFVGKGLGGTSLINANVFLECDKRTLTLSAWPPEIRNDPSALDPYYTRAKEMLQPTPYPEDLPPPKKLSVLEKQAEALGLKQNFYRVPQTTFFREGLNNAGVQMKASTGSGQDCTGVNDGSKNSVLMNYIPDAWNWGAEIFCECEARYIRRDPTGQGYIILFAWHGVGREKFGEAFNTHLMWVRAKEFCFLAAGSLGTTEILLRSRAHGLKLSPTVGQRLSGNGDILSFGYNCDESVNGIGRVNPTVDQPPGPTITGIIDNRDAATSRNVLDAYVIQEGAIPESLAPLIQSMLELMPGKQQPKTPSAKDQLQRLMSRADARFLGPYSKNGSVGRTQTYLVMSHDTNEAVLSLDNDKPHLQFRGVGRTEHVQRLNSVLAKATHAIGGTLINSPFHAAFNQQEQITVHPLGGAVMSSDGTGKCGATNHLGQLFSGDGSEVHDGLACVDGAMIPTSLGVNPFATITALAERAVYLISQQRGLCIDWKRNNRLDLFGQPAVSRLSHHDLAEAYKVVRTAETTGGVQFTEIMDGHIHVGSDINNFAVAEETAKASSSSGLLYLSVSALSMKDASIATGTFSCRALSKDPLLAKGKVDFFSADETISEGSNLVYRLALESTDGTTYHMHGKKALTMNMAFSLTSTWKATTTLHTTLTHPDGTLAGRGVLRVSWRNFTSELKTLSALPTGNILDRASTLSSFVGNFAQKTAPFYLGPLAALKTSQQHSTAAACSETYRPKAPPTSTITLTARDGVTSTLRTWAPTTTATSPSNKRAILMIPGASVSHAIFALPTVRTNAVEYLTARGHTVSVLSHRFSATPECAAGGTAFEARLDVLAALQHLRAHASRDEDQHEQQGQGQQQQKKIYIVAHCMGAVATAIGLLDGTVPAAWLAGLAVTQVFAHLVFGRWNALKAGNPCLPRAYAGIAGSPWFPMAAGEGEKETKTAAAAVQRAIDQALRFYPVEGGAEVCRSAVCHRFSLTYGRCWQHANLNRATHERLAEVLGGVHMRMLAETMGMGRVGRVLDGEGADTVVTDEGLERLRGLPILFVSGGANVVFDPESTFITYDLLRRRFGPDLYHRRVVPGYGHLDTWMGKDSARDVFPIMEEHIRGL